MTTILITGNVVDGLRFIGPFEDSQDAIAYAETKLDGDWNTAELDEPENTCECCGEDSDNGRACGSTRHGQHVPRFG